MRQLSSRWPVMLAIWVAIFSAAATSILIFGNTLTLALLVVVAVSALLLHAPGILSLASWALFTVVPEAVGNNELASGWTSLTYRSLVGSVDLADIVLALALVALLFASPSAPLDLWHRHRRLVIAYALFLATVGLSMAVNGQLLRLVALKPLVFMPAAILWGFGAASIPSLSSWITPLLFGGAGVSIAIGLFNALGGTGSQFAGLNLAFTDRASVFLIVVALLVLINDGLRAGAIVKPARSWWWLPYAVAGLMTVALSLRRTMWLTFAVGVGFSVALVVRRSRLRALALGLGIIGITGAASLGILAATGYLSTLTTHAQSAVSTLGGRGTELSITTRLFEEVDALRTARRRPILGGGPLARYEPSFGYMPGLNTSYVHNNYTWLLLHYGILGLVTYLAFLWQLLRALAGVDEAREPEHTRPALRLGVLAAVVGILPAMAGDSLLTAPQRWPLLVGFLAGAALGLPPYAGTSAERPAA